MKNNNLFFMLFPNLKRDIWLIAFVTGFSFISACVLNFSPEDAEWRGFAEAIFIFSLLVLAPAFTWFFMHYFVRLLAIYAVRREEEAERREEEAICQRERAVIKNNNPSIKDFPGLKPAICSLAVVIGFCCLCASVLYGLAQDDETRRFADAFIVFYLLLFAFWYRFCLQLPFRAWKREHSASQNE
jgi:hypothetical protein